MSTLEELRCKVTLLGVSIYRDTSRGNVGHSWYIDGDERVPLQTKNGWVGRETERELLEDIIEALTKERT